MMRFASSAHPTTRTINKGGKPSKVGEMPSKRFNKGTKLTRHSNKKKPGRHWEDPNNEGNGVRIDKFDPKSQWPS